MINQATSTAVAGANSKNWLRWANLAFMLYLLLLAVSMVGSGFKMATGDQAKVLFEFASHPIAG
ncbi:sodium-dependent phosphate transporter [Vibrio astriarenae]|nr:sodium-dependent phosphate transporter [Vibrio sp. C7]